MSLSSAVPPRPYGSIGGDYNRNTLARLAGLLYILIAIAAGVAHFYVPSQIMVAGDAAATVGILQAAPHWLRLAFGSEIVVLLSEIALCILLYVLFRPVSRTLALMMAVFRLVMTTIHGINLLNYFLVMLAVNGDGALAAFSAQQLQALTLFFLDAHHYGFVIGIFFLVPHVFILGYLIIKSAYVPRLFGGLFLLAACGYLVDVCAQLLFASYSETPALIAMVIAISEIAFPLWLLVKGVKETGDPTGL
jgi:hypothetical protein